MIQHMNYLGRIDQPSVVELKRTTYDLVNVLGATVVSPMVVLDKSSFISIDTNIKYEKLNEVGLPSLTSRLEAKNWEHINQPAQSFQRYCKDGIVLEFELPQNGWPLRNSYPLEVSWGSGDALCKKAK
jgi:hypothetical protein